MDQNWENMEMMAKTRNGGSWTELDPCLYPPCPPQQPRTPLAVRGVRIHLAIVVSEWTPRGPSAGEPLVELHRPLPPPTVAPLPSTTFTARRALPARTHRGPTPHRRRCPLPVRHVTAATAPSPRRRRPRRAAPPRQDVTTDLRRSRLSANSIAVGRENG